MIEYRILEELRIKYTNRPPPVSISQSTPSLFSSTFLVTARFCMGAGSGLGFVCAPILLTELVINFLILKFVPSSYRLIEGRAFRCLSALDRLTFSYLDSHFVFRL